MHALHRKAEINYFVFIYMCVKSVLSDNFSGEKFKLR